MSLKQEYARQYYLKNRKRLIKYTKNWNNTHKKQRMGYMKTYFPEYYQTNKKKLDKRNNLWAKIHRKLSNKIKQEYRSRNPDIDKEYYEHIKNEKWYQDRVNQYREDHKKETSKYNKIYRKKYPEKKLKSDRKSLRKLLDNGFFPQLKNTLELESAYRSWANTVKKRDKNTCQKCGSKKNLNAHHKRPKTKYPKLSLIVSNGITLCKKCHTNHHSS